MLSLLCKGGVKRDHMAIAISFAAALLMSLEALHPGRCVLFNLDDAQSYSLCATLATVSMFLGSLLLARHIKSK